jgi:hypothetical protein
MNCSLAWASACVAAAIAPVAAAATNTVFAFRNLGIVMTSSLEW